LAKEEKSLAEQSGRGVRFSPTGPTSLGLVKAIINVVEEQAREIDELKKRNSGAR
jgi:hypothetical protein